jgi:putative flippase GtrA
VTGLQHAPPEPLAASVPRSRARAQRARRELRRRANWVQLLAFCVVGASGYVVNLAVYTLLLTLGVAFVVSAVGSFVVAVANNYTLNRLITFRDRRGCVVRQGARYLSVSVVALAANIAVLTALVWAGVGEVPAQGAAIVVVTPVSFLGNRLWSFGR